MWILLLTSVLSLLGLLLFFHNHASRRYFESKGIPYMGNTNVRLLLNTFRGIGTVQDFANQYNAVKQKGIKLGGTNVFGQRALMVTDTELLKAILVKDFDHFTDRRTFALSSNDYLFAKMLMLQKGDPWKYLRTKLSPTFTTAKIKSMFHLFRKSGQKFVKFLESEIEMSNGEIELEDGFSKFAMDIIASAACGFDSEAFNQKEPSQFELMGKSLQIQFGGLQIIKIILMNGLPIKITNFLGFSLLRRKPQDFFSSVIKSSINQRIEKPKKGNDFIQLMLAAREGKLKTEENEFQVFENDAIPKPNGVAAGVIKTSELLDDDGIAANCLLFILAGFDTTQSLLLFAAYALAINQDVQERLRAEIDQVLEDDNGECTYDGLAKMTYLDMFINETLRFWPPVKATDRNCTMDYKIPGSEFVVRKGDAVVIPTYGLHHDEDFYVNPEKFDPERFSPENKSKINPYAFLPFGQGPRNCIGIKFGLTEAKVVISKLIHNFKIHPSPKTLIPMKFANTESLKPEGGLFVALKKIKH